MSATPDTGAHAARDHVDGTDVHDLVLRSFRRPGVVFWAAAAILAALVVLGLFAWIVQLQKGMGAAGYNDQSLWAIYIADVVTLIGVSYGGAVISAILRLTGATWRAPLTRLAEGTAVVTVIVGALMVIPHLGRPDRIWEMLTRPNFRSPEFWDMVAMTTYATASIVFFVLPLIPDMASFTTRGDTQLGWRRKLYRGMSRGWVGAPEQRNVLHRALTVMAIMIIPLAVSVHSVLSWAFSLVSRPWWHESIWAPYFVVAALYSGVALVILVVAAFRRAHHLEGLITDRHFARLGFIMATLSATYLYLTFADMLPGSYVGEPMTSAVFHALLVGRYAVWFWLFVVAGGFLPLLLVALPATRNARGMVAASLMVIPAMWLKRMLMVLAPANYDRINDVFGNYHFTWVSVCLSLGAVAAIPLMLMLLFRVVPLVDVHEVEELGQADPEASDRRLAGRRRNAGVSTVQGATVARQASAGGTVLAVILALGLVGLFGVRAAQPAQAAPASDASKVSMTGTATGGSSVQLVAQVTTSDGKPLPKAKVTFTQAVTDFGARAKPLQIGVATTGADGQAKLSYDSPVTGDQKYSANVAASSGHAAASAATTVAVQQAAQVYHPAGYKPLHGVGQATIPILLTLVALVWLLLIVQVARVVRVLRRGGRGTTTRDTDVPADGGATAASA